MQMANPIQDIKLPERIELRPIRELIPYAHNSRHGSERQEAVA
jgi:hypothetical protein